MKAGIIGCGFIGSEIAQFLDNDESFELIGLNDIDESKAGGLGKKLVIDHGYGLATVYGHTSEILVKEGDRISRGQAIARIGTTGRSTGPHLHYEVLVNGIPVDPKRFMLEQL